MSSTTTTPNHAATPGTATANGPRIEQTSRRRLLRRSNLLSWLAAGFLVIVVLSAIFGPLIAPYDPAAQDLLQRLRPPAGIGKGTTEHLLGTDQLGRDVLSRLILGSRISVLVGVLAAILSGLIGSTIGIVAGFSGGWIDRVLMRLTDIQLAFPSLLLALAVVGFLGASVVNVIIVLGITSWVAYARVLRAEVLSLRERDFVVAARAIGVPPLTIMRRHLLPNVVGPLATIATLQVGSAILAESALSFLGLGVPPTTVTWGAMLSDGQLYLGTAWWLGVLPGLALLLTVLSINVAGDALRDLADPKVYRR